MNTLSLKELRAQSKKAFAAKASVTTEDLNLTVVANKGTVHTVPSGEVVKKPYHREETYCKISKQDSGKLRPVSITRSQQRLMVKDEMFR